MTERPGTPFLTYLDRRRDVCLSYGDPRPLHRDLDLHLLASGIRYDSFTLKLVQDGLSALSLYMVSRPRFETLGWTVNLQVPARNLFFTGSAREGTVIGRAFLENVQPSPRNLFYAQTSRPFGEPQTSYVEVEGTDIFRIVEQYCGRSDQQPVRFFSKGERAALLSVLPDADREWVSSMEGPEVFRLEGTDELKLIGERDVVFHCGCDTGRIASILANLYAEEPDALFQGDDGIEAECPRCGAKHIVSREMFDEALGKLRGA